MISILLSLALTLSTFTSSVTLNQPNPVFGQAVTFTEIYPQDAAKQSRQPQYPNNPNTQIDCYQNGLYVAQFFTIVADKTKITGGWQGVTYPVTLSAPPSNGRPGWTSGGADCYATLYSFDVKNQGHVWAQLEFAVAP